MGDRLGLTDPVETTSAADELLEATLPHAAAHGQGGAERAEALIAGDPTLPRANVWVAAATGELEAVRSFLASDASLVVADGGTRGWDPLLYLCFSRFLRTDDRRAKAMTEIARLLLDAGADPNSCWFDPTEADGNRETPLYGAAGVANRVELARLLIERGADPNDGETAYHMVEHDGVPCAEFIVPELKPLHRGIALGHKLDYDDVDGLRKLLELGADPNGPTPFGNWPIHQAVWRGRSLTFFDLLRQFGAEIDKKNREGRTAYAMAARSGQTVIQSWLIDSGASTELEQVDGFIAACAAGDAATARRILKDDPELSGRFGDRDRAEVCEAAAAGNTTGVRLMLEMGWDVNTRGPVWGETPAHRAAMAGHLETLELLISRGADLTLPDRRYHSTPLGWARHGRQPEVIRFLQGFPGRLDVWDAIELGLTERALELLSGVDPNIAMRGASAGVLLRLAAGFGRLELVEALLERCADPTLRTDYGACAVDVARDQGHEKIEALLQAAKSGSDREA